MIFSTPEWALSWPKRSVILTILVLCSVLPLAESAYGQESGVFFEKFGGASVIRPDGSTLECVTGSSVGELMQCLLEYQNISVCTGSRDFTIPNSAFVSEGPAYFRDGLALHGWKFTTQCLEGPVPPLFPLEPGLPRDWTVNVLADGNECPPGEPFDIANGDCGDKFQLSPPAAQIEPECDRTNPCNIATGNKFETEIDYAPGSSGSLRFARYYNSMGPYRSAENFAHGWRHSYSRALDERPDKFSYARVSESGDRSAVYDTEQDACETGWDDIKTTVWGGSLSTATATFAGGNVCEISVSGSVKANFVVQSVLPRPTYFAPSSIRTISRPNGAVLYFKQVGSAWINEFNAAYTLEPSGTDWVFTDLQDTRETYGSSGQLKRIEYRTGQTEILEYDLTIAEGGDDNPGTLDKVTGPFGHTISLAYDSAGRLASLSTPDGLVQYEYDSDENLVSVTYPDSAVREFVYEDTNLPNHLTGRIDENGDRVSSYAYDENGRATLSERANGNEQVQLVYNADGSTTLSLGSGAVRTYVFSTEQGERKPTLVLGDACAICRDGGIVERTYDSNGFVFETRDWNGNVTRTIRNSRGLTETLIEAVSTPEERTTTIVWHPSLRLPTQIVTPKNTTELTYDSNGFLENIAVRDGTQSRIWAMTYNSAGQLVSIDGPRTDVSDVSTYSYYNCSTGNECGQLELGTNALGHITSFGSYDAAGRILRSSDPNGLETAFTYDLRSNVTSISLTANTGESRTVSMSYDAATQLKTVVTPDIALTYTYDANRYLRTISDNLSNRIDYNYDQMGNLQSEATFDPNNALKRSVDYTHDLNDRLDSVSDGGFSTDIGLDLLGNQTSEIDPNLAVTQHAYDALNRLAQTVDALSGTRAYTYDEHNNLTSVTAPNNAETAYVYDGLDNLVQENSSDRGLITYTYDDAGNQVTKQDARGKITTFTYDALNRVTSETLNDGSSIVYDYDIGGNAIGRLSKISDPSGTTSWTYNNFGETTQKTHEIGAVALSTSYTYDFQGRLATMTLPSGNVVTYGNNGYQATSVTVGRRQVLSGATYEPFGPVNGWIWGDGTIASRQYDPRGLVSSYSIAGETRILSYDPVGRLTAAADTVVDDSYEYDALHRVTSFSPATTAISPSSFSSAPALLTTIQTMNNEIGDVPSEPSAPWLTVATKNVETSGAKVALERSQVNTGSINVKEKIGYLAIETGSGSFLDSSGSEIFYESQVTPETIQGWDTGCFDTAFTNAYLAKPLVIASLNTHNGGDGGWLRRCKLNTTTIGLTVDEDKFGDPERRHNNAESVGLVAFSQAFDAQFTDESGNWGMETAKVTLPSTSTTPEFTSVTFRQSYVRKPVVFVLPNKSGSNPAAVRIRNVTKTGFQVVQVEPAPENGTHSSMTIHYLAVEPGSHTLPNGAQLVVGRKATLKQKHGSGVVGEESWANIRFDSDSVNLASQLFEYDGNGNRLSFTQENVLYAYTYSTSNGNRLLSTSGPLAKSLTYDASGNIVADGIHTFGYDDRGRLVDIDSGAVVYQYNGQGQRVVKDTGEQTLFVYGGAGELLGEYDALGNAIKETVWFNGAPVAVLVGADTYFVHTDQLGVPRAITDVGEVIWSWDSDPFGASRANEDPDGDSAIFVYNLRFPGQYFDDETGFHYNHFRTYDPATGRYLESDPIGLAGGLNTYSYALGNPVSYVDPTGQFVPQIIGGLIGGLTAGGAAVLAGGDLSTVLTNTAIGIGAGVLTTIPGLNAYGAAALGGVVGAGANVLGQGLESGFGCIDTTEAIVAGLAGTLAGGIGNRFANRLVPNRNLPGNPTQFVRQGQAPRQLPNPSSESIAGPARAKADAAISATIGGAANLAGVAIFDSENCACR